MAVPITAPEPIQGDAVTVDKPGSSFHGMVGQVIRVMESTVGAPTLFRVLLDSPPFGYEQGVHFAATELVVMGRR